MWLIDSKVIRYVMLAYIGVASLSLWSNIVMFDLSTYNMSCLSYLHVVVRLCTCQAHISDA